MFLLTFVCFLRFPLLCFACFVLFLLFLLFVFFPIWFFLVLTLPWQKFLPATEGDDLHNNVEMKTFSAVRINLIFYIKFLITRSPHPEKGTLSSGQCPLTKGAKASFCARFMKVCRFWNIFKIAVELKCSYFGQVPSPVWLTRSRTFCLTPEGCWRIIIDNAIKSKN